MFEKMFEKRPVGSVVALRTCLQSDLLYQEENRDLAEQNEKAPCASVEAQASVCRPKSRPFMRPAIAGCCLL